MNEELDAIRERICPHCGSAIAVGATFCPHCTRRAIGYVECHECCEPIAKKAKYCPCCGQRIRKYKTGLQYELPALDLSLRARRLGMLVRGLSATGLIRPMRVHANHDRVLIVRWRALGFDHEEERFELKDLESADLRRGVFWVSVILKANDEERAEPLVLRGLPKREARIFAHRLNTELRTMRPREREGEDESHAAPHRARRTDGE